MRTEEEELSSLQSYHSNHLLRVRNLAEELSCANIDCVQHSGEKDDLDRQPARSQERAQVMRLREQKIHGHDHFHSEGDRRIATGKWAYRWWKQLTGSRIDEVDISSGPSPTLQLQKLRRKVAAGLQILTDSAVLQSHRTLKQTAMIKGTARANLESRR